MLEAPREGATIIRDALTPARPDPTILTRTALAAANRNAVRFLASTGPSRLEREMHAITRLARGEHLLAPFRGLLR